MIWIVCHIGDTFLSRNYSEGSVRVKAFWLYLANDSYFRTSYHMDFSKWVIYYYLNKHCLLDAKSPTRGPKWAGLRSDIPPKV